MLEFSSPPDLRDTTLVLAFDGWNDAGEAATSAITHLVEELGARQIASIGLDAYFDYQRVRPTIRVVDGVVESLEWPLTEFRLHHAPGTRLIFGTGPEPHLGWREFIDHLVEGLGQCDVRRVIALGGLLADVPHTRPSPIAGTSTEGEQRDRFGLGDTDYEGPTGIVGVLLDRFQREGLATTSLWASVPHYVQVTPNPRATVSLLQALRSVLGVVVPLEGLEENARDFEHDVDEAMEDNEEVVTYVRMLEQRYDSMRADDGEGHVAVGLGEGQLPSGDELAAELEDFLKAQDDD